MAIGRKDQYIHQYIRYGLPQQLKEDDRRAIARILDVDEQELSSKPLFPPISPLHSDGISVLIDQATKFISNLRKKNIDTISIDMLDAVACCGTGIENLNENVNGKWLMPLIDSRQITMSAPENIKMIKVKGDSMEPTLKEGDWVLVDISRISPDSDGLFLLRLAGGLAVKRIQCGLGNSINVLSDNKNYPPLPPTSIAGAQLSKRCPAFSLSSGIMQTLTDCFCPFWCKIKLHRKLISQTIDSRSIT